MEEKHEEIIFSGRQIDSRVYEGPLWPFLKERMESYGSLIALVNPYTEEEICFKDLVVMTEKVARGLLKLGLNQGAALCVVSRNSVEFVLLILGTYAIGAFVHTPNPLSMPAELRRQIELSEARLVVTTPEFIASVQEAVKDTDTRIITVGPRDGHLNFSDLLALGSEDVTLPPAPEDPRTAIASLLFSSGTTGLPKGVIITQRNIMAWVHQFNAQDGPLLSTDDTTVLFLQLFHAYGQVVALSASLAYGCRVVLVTKFEINEFLSFVAKYRATFLSLVPPVIIAMVNHPKLSTYDLSSVRQAMSAAAPLGKELEIQLSQKMGRTFLVQGYGMTENMAVTLRSLRHQLPGSCGRLLPNTQAKIVDPVSGKTLGVNQAGELYLRGPQVMLGYLKNPEATRETIGSDGFMRTGDVARIDADGFMYILDRLKELIKFKGEQVPPAMLEDILLNYPNIADACVIGKPDLEAGELPRAYVVPVEGANLSEQEVIDYVAKKVPSYMQLRGGVEFRAFIPKSPSGKILRRLLREELRQATKSHL